KTVQIDAAGTVHVEYSYNDRGRGDHIAATWKLNAAGVPTEYEGHGNDYMKAPVDERFEVKDGKARWKNRSEQGEQASTGKAFIFRLIRRRNSPACSRVLCSRRRATSCHYCLPAKRVSRRRASLVSTVHPVSSEPVSFACNVSATVSAGVCVKNPRLCYSGER